MSNKTYSLANKVFTEMVENSASPINQGGQESFNPVGIVKSINEFMAILVEANDTYNTTFQIADNSRLIFAEDSPSDQIIKLNNGTSSTEITSGTANDIRVITYLASEEPAVISTRKINDSGTQMIKWRLNKVFDDPEYTGYSIARYIKEIEATVTFKVWGKFFQDIRQRASLLKNVIDSNVWYFKHKGLRDIVWLSSFEEDAWDNKNLAKYKTEKYMIRFAEVKEVREKNLEQIVIQLGLQ